MRATGTDRFPGTVASTAASGTATPAPLPEGSIYSDATLTILNSKNIAKQYAQLSEDILSKKRSY